MMMDILICLVLLAGIGACLFEVYVLITFVRSGFGKYPPFFPSFGKMKKRCLQEMREILEAAEKPLKVVDLGCGNGSLIMPLAKEFPQHEFLGYEWDVVPYAMASFRARRIKNVHLFCEDFTKVDLEEADVIVVFGCDQLFASWGSELTEKLRQGTIVISEAFEIKQMKAQKIIEAPSYGMGLKIYRYQK